MKLLVTGKTGQLGHDICKELEARGHEVIGMGSADMDITDADAVRKVLYANRPEIVIHCAAYTAVDNAEDEVETCRRVNVDGTENIARICRELDAVMLYLSTDYVFSGTDERPWKPEDEAEPLGVYGLTKYEGELAVKKYLKKYFIVRVSWIYGINGKNFVKTMLRLGEERGAVSVVNDQIGSPTYTRDLAVLLADMAESKKYGTYHASNEGVCSWYEFACQIFREAGMDYVTVTPVDSASFPAKAKRPSNSRMDKGKLTANGFSLLPTWQDALHRFMKEL